GARARALADAAHPREQLHDARRPRLPLRPLAREHPRGAQRHGPAALPTADAERADRRARAARARAGRAGRALPRHGLRAQGAGPDAARRGAAGAGAAAAAAAGGGPGPARRRPAGAPPAARRAGRLGAADRVLWLGARPDPERLLRAADVLVLPTAYDPAANATIEALASGVPVVTSASNGASEILQPGRHGSVVPAPVHPDD